MEKEKIAELFMKGIDCSQVVAGAFAEELGITQEEAYKMAAGFGGGTILLLKYPHSFRLHTTFSC